MPRKLNPRGMNRCLGCLSCMIACSAINHGSHSVVKSAIKVRTTGGLASSFVAVVCRACKEPTCLDVCPAHALKYRPGGGVVLDKELCYGCRRCVPACSVGAVSFDRETERPIICHHCGVCTSFCPHQCIVMVDVKEDNELAE